MVAFARFVLVQRIDDELLILAGNFRHRVLRIGIFISHHAMTAVAAVDELTSRGLVAFGMHTRGGKEGCGYGQAKQLQAIHQDHSHDSGWYMEISPGSIVVAFQSEQYRRRAVRDVSRRGEW